MTDEQLRDIFREVAPGQLPAIFAAHWPGLKAFARAASADEFERGRQQGIKQERALWKLAAEGQAIEAHPEPLPAGVEPVAWRLRYRSEPGMIGHYPWAYEEKRRRGEHSSLEVEPLYATPPTLTDAQCDAIHFGLSEWAKDIDARMGLPRPDLKSRALIRAAAGGG